LECELHDLLSFAAEPRCLRGIITLREIGLAPLVRCQQCHGLEEVRVLQRSECTMLIESYLSRLPVIIEPEVLGGECGGHQLEHVECNAARVDLLENGAHGLLGCSLLQADHGYRV